MSAFSVGRRPSGAFSRIAISEQLAVELVEKLNQAIGLATSFNVPELRNGFLDTANRLDDAINDSVDAGGEIPNGHNSKNS